MTLSDLAIYSMTRSIARPLCDICTEYNDESQNGTSDVTLALVSQLVHGEIGCSKWKKTLAYLLVLPGSRARIVRCGGRYDPQLVKRSSE